MESFLKRVLRHPRLKEDSDLHMFLTSDETLNVEDKKKEESTAKGLIGFFSESLLPGFTQAAKKAETDEDYEKKKAEIDQLEEQLKNMLKVLEALSKQRKDLGVSMSEFGDAVFSVATLEVNQDLAEQLNLFGDLHRRMRVLHEQQAKHDFHSLVFTVDEYLRTIGSIRHAFAARVKAFTSYQAASQQFQKKKEALDRLHATSRLQADAKSQETPWDEMEKDLNHSKEHLRLVSDRLDLELKRFDEERVRDFACSLKGFLTSLVQTQREIVALWQNFVDGMQKPAPNASHPGMTLALNGAYPSY